MWNQVYNPLGDATFSTLAAAVPVVTLLALIDSNKVKAHLVIALIAANLVAIVIFTSRPACLCGRPFVPADGRDRPLRDVARGDRRRHDRRLQLLLIAFAFGAFFEGPSGFGTPVAVTGAALIGLGFSPLGGRRTVPHRQHLAGLLRRAGHAHLHPRQRHRP